jgi:anti-sigma factor RsiW
MTDDRMANDCTKWKDQLFDAALTGTPAGSFEEHLSHCANCTAKLAALRTRRERLDALLPLVAQGADPSPEFRARVLAATQEASGTTRTPFLRGWVLAGAIAVFIATLTIGLSLHQRSQSTPPQTELSAAEKLAQWRAPSDVLLEFPGSEILRTTPRLGESYLHVPAKISKED